MTRSSKRPLSSKLSLLLLAGLFLGACSGGGDGGSASTPPASTPPTGSPPPPPPPPPVAQLLQQGYLKASNTDAEDHLGILCCGFRRHGGCGGPTGKTVMRLG